MGRISVITFLSFLLLPTLLWSQVIEEELEVDKVEESKKRYSISASLSTSSSLHNSSDPDKREMTELRLGHTYQFDHFGLNLSIAGTQDHRGERKWYWSDGTISAQKSFRSLGAVQTSAALTGIVPLSENNRKYRKMVTGFILSPNFFLPMAPYGAERLSFSLRPSAAYYIHQHEVALNGSSNTRNTLGARLTSSLRLSSHLTFSLAGTYSRAFTYQGNTRDSYGFSTALDLALSDTFSAQFGHSNSGNPLRPNGLENEISFFDSRNTVLYLALSMRI